MKSGLTVVIPLIHQKNLQILGVTEELLPVY